LDPHLLRILNASRKCRCCGATFAELLSLSCDRPDICSEDLIVQDNSAIVAENGDILTEDFCRLGELYFIRAILTFPVANSGGAEFVLGTWANLPVEDFHTYLAIFDGQEEELPPKRPVWLANVIPLHEGKPAACTLVMRSEGQYPELDIAEPGHPLYELQNRGLTFEELLGMLHSYGHDIPSLVYDS